MEVEWVDKNVDHHLLVLAEPEVDRGAKTNHTTHTHTQDPHAIYLLSTPSSLLMLSKRGVALPHSVRCRLHRYIGYFIEDTQTSESVSTSRSAISKAALT